MIHSHITIMLSCQDNTLHLLYTVEYMYNRTVTASGKAEMFSDLIGIITVITTLARHI